MNAIVKVHSMLPAQIHGEWRVSPGPDHGPEGGYDTAAGKNLRKTVEETYTDEVKGS